MPDLQGLRAFVAAAFLVKNGSSVFMASGETSADSCAQWMGVADHESVDLLEYELPPAPKSSESVAP